MLGQLIAWLQLYGKSDQLLQYIRGVKIMTQGLSTFTSIPKWTVTFISLWFKKYVTTEM